MPTGGYSYSYEGEPRFAITEPEDELSSSRRSWDSPGDEDADGVHAKEPDRSATRRGGRSTRGRSSMEEDQDEVQSRPRAGQRGNSRRGSQARQSNRGQASRRSAASESKTGRQKKSRRGFAAMSPEQQREIARKGGLTVSRNRRHMADIGRVGGEHSHGGRRARR